MAWLLCLLLTFPLTHPVLLRLIRLAMSYSALDSHLKNFKLFGLRVEVCPKSFEPVLGPGC